MTTFRTALTAVVAGVVLATTAGCPAQAPTQPPTDQGVEVEDCDAEDWRNRETDCGFAPTRKATPTAKAKVTPKTGKTRGTKR